MKLCTYTPWMIISISYFQIRSISISYLFHHSLTHSLTHYYSFASSKLARVCESHTQSACDQHCLIVSLHKFVFMISPKVYIAEKRYLVSQNQDKNTFLMVLLLKQSVTSANLQFISDLCKPIMCLQHQSVKLFYSVFLV